MSPASCGLRSRGAGDEPLTVAPGAEPRWPGAGPTARPDGARRAGRPGTALRALTPRELPRVLPGQPGAQRAPGSQGLGLQGPPAACPPDPGVRQPAAALTWHCPAPHAHAGPEVLCSHHWLGGQLPPGLPSRARSPWSTPAPGLPLLAGDLQEPTGSGGHPAGLRGGQRHTATQSRPPAHPALQLARGWRQPHEGQGAEDSLRQPGRQPSVRQLRLG